MSSPAKTASYMREIVIGLLVSLVAAAAASALSFVLSPATVMRAVVAGVGFVLVLRAVASSREKSGRIVALLVWMSAALATAYAGIALPAYVAMHLALLWLARAFFVHRSFVAMLADFGLATLSISFAVWAAVSTSSVFLATWCFCVVQAAHVGIPAFVARFSSRPDESPLGGDEYRRFDDAVAAAEAALRRIAAR
jgi:hypothetical protein